MGWCPACGMDGFHRTVHDTDPYRGEYEQATCSYCGYQDEAEWLPEGWDQQEDEDEEENETDI